MTSDARSRTNVIKKPAEGAGCKEIEVREFQMKDNEKKNKIVPFTVLVVIIVAAILVLSTFWMGRSANQATEEAVRSVSRLYLDELAGRREQVVSTNLESSIGNMKEAISLMTDEDLSSMESLQSFQAEMKKLYELNKFAFVDSDGLIYTSQGTRTDIKSYDFDYKTLSAPDISVTGLDTDDKKVIIAIPVKGKTFQGKRLTVCFTEKDMSALLDGLSLQSDTNEMTFCNIYTRDGIALSNLVLGGLASEDNLLDALKTADFEEGYSFKEMNRDFTGGKPGIASFSYNGIQESLDFVPIEGTNWMLTYLVRESVITDQISGVSDKMTRRSFIQTILTIIALVIVFGIMILQIRRSSKLTLEKEKIETENRIKQEEMQQRLTLQEQLLEQEKQRAQQDNMITALASDYRSVYYIDLDNDRGICYRTDPATNTMLSEGEEFGYSETFRKYAELYVDENFREGFLEFVKPEIIRENLEKNLVASYRYLTNKNGQERYEMLRMAGVRHAEDREDHMIHAVGAGFSDVDSETRDSMAQQQALSDALELAEEANKAKTAFLSNMSHEIRTPMNAIIGLDSIALNDPDVPEKTRDSLEKIGDSARHLLGLINDILDVSRIEAGTMVIRNEEFSFSKVLEQINTMVSSQCSEKGLEYDCKLNGQIDEYYVGDEMKLKQVLLNILSNAVKFTPEGGEVSMTVDKTASFGNKSTLQFKIKDTGIGMDKEFIPKLFNAFSQEDSSSTNKFGSTGLGMAITKSIVEMMNGRIDVESEKGKGTCFTVTITFQDCDRTETEDGISRIDPKQMSVLVIDDDPIACEHAKVVLEEAGITSETVLSGAEALEKVRLAHARRTPYNLILVDWKMPEMDGIETSRKIREIVGTDSAIIILTAYNWDEIIDKAVEAGVDSFVAKPLFAASVMDEFHKATRKKGMSGTETKAAADLTGRKILLAEDMPVNAEIMKEVLKMRQMEADHAENGKIALEKFQASPEGYYDAILMDIRMPEMDGLTATSRIRELDREDAKKIPIIALTANAFDEDVQSSLQAGLDAHLSKPVEPDSLFSTLEELIQDD